MLKKFLYKRLFISPVVFFVFFMANHQVISNNHVETLLVAQIIGEESSKTINRYKINQPQSGVALKDGFTEGKATDKATTKWYPKGARAPIIDAYKLSKDIIELGEKYDLDPLMILSIIRVESSFDPHAQSNKGAVGLMQVMPILVKEVGDSVNVKNKSELWNQHNNLKVGVHYFSKMLNKYKGDVGKALAAYNMGPGNLNKSLKYRGTFSFGYSKKVLKHYARYLKQKQNFLMNS